MDLCTTENVYHNHNTLLTFEQNGRENNFAKMENLLFRWKNKTVKNIPLKRQKKGIIQTEILYN